MIQKIKNTKKLLFDHSNDFYYLVDLNDNLKVLFTKSELCKALHRYKKWINKPNKE